MKIDKPKYKDYDHNTGWATVLEDYPIIQKLRDEALEQEKTFTEVLNSKIGEERFTGKEEMNAEFIGEIVEALGV